MISKSLQQEILNQLNQKEEDFNEIKSINRVSGGSINQSFSIEFANQRKVFVKVNLAKEFPKMFQLERKGLELLAANSSLRVPEVFYCSEVDNEAFLLMEYVDTAKPKKEFWHEFAVQLAQLHAKSNSHFGLDHDNYIGSLKQPNQLTDNWIDFFIQYRLEHQAALAYDQGNLSSASKNKLNLLFPKLENLIPKEPAALLHGDLWSGNFLVDGNGEACIIDPAVYYGHREVDIAMAHLFGGFAAEFFNVYNQSFPLEKGWEERIDLFNLYPLLVHVNLFGGAYASRLESVLKRFV